MPLSFGQPKRVVRGSAFPQLGREFYLQDYLQASAVERSRKRERDEHSHGWARSSRATSNKRRLLSAGALDTQTSAAQLLKKPSLDVRRSRRR